MFAVQNIAQLWDRCLFWFPRYGHGNKNSNSKYSVVFTSCCTFPQPYMYAYVNMYVCRMFTLLSLCVCECAFAVVLNVL